MSLSSEEQSEYAKLSKKIIKEDSRCCFGIVWFDNEADANRYGLLVSKSGQKYNGGFSHGMSCGRDKAWDSKEGESPMFSVTIR